MVISLSFSAYRYNESKDYRHKRKEGGMPSIPLKRPLCALLALAALLVFPGTARAAVGDVRLVSATPSGIESDGTANTGRKNILRKDVSTGEVACSSVSAAGSKANADCFNCDLDASGQFAVFDSSSTNLVDGSPTSGREIFRKELNYYTFFFFAEGYTGDGFQEYLCLGNPGSSDVMVT